MIPKLTWITHQHVITAADAANVLATFVTWGYHGEGVTFGYSDPKPRFHSTPWRVHYMSSWLVDSTGFLVQGQIVTIGEICAPLTEQFAEIASACQGPGVKARLVSDVGYPITHGLFSMLWVPVVAGQVLWTRLKYEAMR